MADNPCDQRIKIEVTYGLEQDKPKNRFGSIIAFDSDEEQIKKAIRWELARLKKKDGYLIWITVRGWCLEHNELLLNSQQLGVVVEASADSNVLTDKKSRDSWLDMICSEWLKAIVYMAFSDEIIQIPLAAKGFTFTCS